jgi:hypothetical protein
MTVAERIRKAALGRTPRENADLTAGWLDHRSEEWQAIRPWADNTEGSFIRLSPVERRMFLLFVAEAIEGAQ